MKKSEVIASLVWKFLERGGTQAAQFIIQLILARLLVPEDYGIIAIVTVFIQIANVIVQNGFSVALIQKKEVNDIDLSSVLYLNLFIALMIYVVLFFCAPYIAQFYDNPILIPVFRVLSITLFFGAINSVQQAIVARRLQFKKYFLSSIIGIAISAIIGVFLAYKGYGVWALVAQQLANSFLVLLVLCFSVRWRPKMVFSLSRIRSLFSFGWKLLLSSLIDSIYNNLYDLVIGRKFSSVELAYYSRGRQFPSTIIQNFDGAISSVMLPVLSSQQENTKEIKRMMRRSIITSSFVIFPIAAGLIAIAEIMVKLMLTEQWLSCVPFIRIMSITYALWPIHTSNLQAIKAMGRSDIFLKMEILKKTVGSIILLVTIPLGIIPMAIGQVVAGLISTIINSYPNKIMLHYGYKEQAGDILPSLSISIVMGVIVYSLTFIGIGTLATLVLQLIVGITVYISLALLFKMESLEYILNSIKEHKSNHG